MVSSGQDFYACLIRSTMGATSSHYLSKLTLLGYEGEFLICLICNFFLVCLFSAQYVAGIDNRIMDALSCLQEERFFSFPVLYSTDQLGLFPLFRPPPQMALHLAGTTLSTFSGSACLLLGSPTGNSGHTPSELGHLVLQLSQATPFLYLGNWQVEVLWGQNLHSTALVDWLLMISYSSFNTASEVCLNLWAQHFTLGWTLCSIY